MPFPHAGISDPNSRVSSAGRPNGTPLIRHLLLVVTAVALPLLLLAAGTTWSQYRGERRRAEIQLVEQARGLAQLVDRQFQITEAVLRTLASSSALTRGDLSAFAAEMRAARDQLAPSGTRAAKQIAIRLLDAQGNLRLDTRGNEHVARRGIPASTAAIASGQPQISGLFFGSVDPQPDIAVIVPVFPADQSPGPGRATGTIGMNMPRKWLLAVLSSIALPPGAVASVQDRRGLTVARSAADAAMVGTPPAPPVLQAILRDNAGIVSGVRTREGVRCIVAYAHAPLSHFIVKLDVPERVFLAPLHAVLLRTALLGAAFLVLAAGLALLFGRQIAAALRRVPGVAVAQAHGIAAASTGLREADELAAVLGDTLAERQDAEQRLRDSEEQLRLAVESAEIGLWDVDPVNDKLYWPPLVKAMFGISPDAPVTMADFYAGLHPDDRDRVCTAFATALDPVARAVYDVDYRTVGKEDGVVRWVAAKGRGIFDDSGQCVRVIGTAIDISARKAAEQQLHELNETLEQRVAQAVMERERVWRNSRDLLTVVDTNGIFRAINPAWNAVLGYSPSALIGRSFRDFVWPDDAEISEHAFAAAASGGDLTNFENRLRHQDGTPRWIAWHATCEGHLLYAYGRHVTTEKAAAAELAEAQERLHQAQKIETIGQLTGGVAHDFNNLLTPIVGTLDLLHRKLDGDKSTQRLIAAALQAAERARTLIQRLLAFSRRQHLEARAVDVRALIENLADLAARSLGPQVRLLLRIADGLPPVRVDPNQLELALLNLAVNARDAMGGSGTLTVAVAEETAERSGRLPPGRYVRIAVTDTGCGMDEATLQRAVEPFFTTKGVGHGTGLGSPWCTGWRRSPAANSHWTAHLGPEPRQPSGCP